MKNPLPHNMVSPLGLLSLLLVLFAINLFTRNAFIRLDLTADKRYSLSEVTKAYLQKLEEPVTIRVYLSGNLNPGFNALRQSVNDLLSEMKVYGGAHLSYTFPEPQKIKDKEVFKRLQKEIKDLDLTPINVVEESKNGERSQKPVFPWAVIEHGKRRYPVRLLVNVAGRSGEENLNTSIENLEYNLMDGIRIASAGEAGKIAFLEGHGELPEDEVYDITEALSHYFQVDRGALGVEPGVLDNYKVVVVAKPVLPFSEQDKYILDQYLMQGGKIIWLVDGVKISMDSLTSGPVTVGVYNDLNLDDMLFNYGIRLNPVLIQDLQCALYPVNFAPAGQKADFHAVPWYYSPLLFQSTDHPITRGLSPVKSEFSSSVDTVGSGLLRRTALLTTSGKSNVFKTPAPVNLALSATNVNQEDFLSGPQTLAYLVEGSFKSVFRNRFVPAGVPATANDMLKASVQTAMIVIGDGDIIRNDVEGAGDNKRIYPLGFDRFTSQNLFSNLDFLLNCVNYLTDDAGWMSLRSKKITLRLLSKTESGEKRTKWQTINVLTPIIVLLLGGLIFVAIRRKRYSK